jgi:Dna[CI] antecedent, DciA
MFLVSGPIRSHCESSRSPVSPIEPREFPPDAKIDFDRMERAGKSLAKLTLGGAVSHEELARAAWPAAVGKRIALHAAAKSLVRGSLIVEVEDAVWQKQLFQLRFSILAKLRETLGNGIIEDVEFRIATPRRPPQQARSLDQERPLDEADRIRDPVLRILYRQARKKASA